MIRTRTRLEDKAALDHALAQFTEDMRTRLHEMVDRGKVDWDSPVCEEDICYDMMADAVDAENSGNRTKLHDIANRAMMLWWQAWRMS